MDEYYCPNCGATLNTQSGFDPNNGTWTCAECGQHLMDDDTFEGDTYEGVAWYCDECGSLLNKQSGFSDSYGTWTCTECGHTNGTTDDDIIEDSFSCPQCGASLNNQCGFNKYNDYHECSSCGTKLYHSYSDDEYSIVEDEEEEKIQCPSCGANLKEQFCFADYEDDWDCTECGAHLHRDYSFDPYIVSDNENDDDDSDYNAETEKSGDSYSNSTSYSASSYDDDDDFSYGSSSYCPSSNRFIFKKLLRNICKVLNIIKKIVIGIAIAAVVGFIVYNIYEISKQTPVGIDSNSISGKQYEVIVADLVEAGFKNITTQPLGDLSPDAEQVVGIVDHVSIDGETSFTTDTKYPNDAKIIVYYHSIKMIFPPMSSYVAKGENFDEVFLLYQDAGFVNIKLEAIDDLVFGWFTKDGSVESIAIDGETKFSTEHSYRPDVEVVIKYHTLKKNKPKK